MSGSSGLVGSALVGALGRNGHQVVRLVRASPKDSSEVSLEKASALEGLDAVVHLAGESIMGRWTDRKKKRILESRVKGTQLLSESLSRFSRRPGVLACASAIGFYGNRGDEILTEESPPGSLFLSEVCRQWEEAARPAPQSGIRVVNLRFGMILSPMGGALAKMLFPFKMGVGGILGTGRQWMSWITLQDAVRVVEETLKNEKLQGPVNVVSPGPVTNHELTKTLGKVLSRPTLIPMPAFAARLVFGQMAEELLLASARVMPGRLLKAGYRFEHPKLEEALRFLLGK